MTFLENKKTSSPAETAETCSVRRLGQTACCDRRGVGGLVWNGFTLLRQPTFPIDASGSEAWLPPRRPVAAGGAWQEPFSPGSLSPHPQKKHQNGPQNHLLGNIQTHRHSTSGSKML